MSTPAVHGAPVLCSVQQNDGSVAGLFSQQTSPVATPTPKDLVSSVAPHRPLLIFFTSEQDGRCRRAEGFLAQVLQRRRNHKTFSLRTVARERRPDLLERFRVDQTPTLVVLDEQVVRGKLVAPRGCEEIQAFLAPWLK
jgi:thioredoxin-like negative regulator of GroEL